MKKGRKQLAVIMTALCMATVTVVPSYAGLFSKKPAQTEAAQTKTDYAFTSKETEIRLNQEAAPILKSLGAAKKCFEQQSCAYQGMDKIYTYDGFELGTYPVKGKEYVSSIYFTDDTAQTQEGIKIGSSYDDMIKAYGKEYKEENGVYRYVLGQTELSIYTTNKVVDAVEYQLITE